MTGSLSYSRNEDVVLRKLRHVKPYLLSALLPNEVTDAFHLMWYRSPATHRQNTYFGYPVDQVPLDLWLYQEIVVSTKPQMIVQTGVMHGGSLLYFAHLLDLMGTPQDSLVIGIDIRLTGRAKTLSHPRIRLIEGSSTDPPIIEQVRTLVGGKPGLVSLDSDHSCAHVAKELELYSQFVGVDMYMVVEDTNVNGHPVYPSHGPGPLEAVEHFLQQNDGFVADDELWQRNLFSFHQKGWLKKIK